MLLRRSSKFEGPPFDQYASISRCTVPEERLPSNLKERVHCEGWFHTGDTKQDVTLMVFAVTYDPNCLFAALLLPRKEEEYLAIVKSAGPTDVDTYGCYWEGDELHLREGLAEGGLMKVERLISDPPHEADLFSLDMLRQGSGSDDDPIRWNSFLTQEIGLRLTPRQRLAAEMAIASSSEVAFPYHWVFQDVSAPF